MRSSLRAFAAAPVALASLALARPAAAQSELESFCAGVPAQGRETCVAVAQTAQSAQPQLGIVLAGGNPVLGTASTSGVRLGVLPRVSLGVRLNAVHGRIPDILDDPDGSDEISAPVPAVGANLSIGLFNGVALAPTVGGFGAIDLLGSVSMIPLGAVEVDGFDSESLVSWGVGARVSLLRESFTLPGASVSVMYRTMNEVRFGEVCYGGVPPQSSSGVCPGDGDFGEASFGLDNWSVRAALGKRVLGLGATVGLGWDRFESQADLAYRAEPTQGGTVVRRESDIDVRNDRVSVFGNLSYTFLVGSLVLEGGYMAGGDAVQGFSQTGEFDPTSGNVFGSLGFRLQL